jgi:hypothetical protein
MSPRQEGFLLSIAVLLVFFAVLFCLGCSLPCTYQGKAVPRQDAGRMKAMRMDVVCPE